MAVSCIMTLFSAIEALDSFLLGVTQSLLFVLDLVNLHRSWPEIASTRCLLLLTFLLLELRLPSIFLIIPPFLDVMVDGLHLFYQESESIWSGDVNHCVFYFLTQPLLVQRYEGILPLF
jgi:hypothetical protein